ncbi:hypothetical protein SAMN05444004_11759 [Jannaschia faecimaris]|uniref:Ethyl tert-butyl ether degradation EthD n=1 Tax=Jannaschia faecimaris TaxID=1244108 RepID=A0A1H3TJZ6_9RHOB|nr:hypothetical protein [Jannaschia faecimaris]SDZ49975.1 hypothetical protein SAMN05444004_11759 [Jannaschia faecimaris]
MITRYALFQGTVHDGQTEAFRAAVLKELVPVWKRMPGATAVHVTFGDSRDEGAPEFPVILATEYPDMDAVQVALESPVRIEGREATQSVLGRFYTGVVHHHVTTAHHYQLQGN